MIEQARSSDAALLHSPSQINTHPLLCVWGCFPVEKEMIHGDKIQSPFLQFRISQLLRVGLHSLFGTADI